MNHPVLSPGYNAAFVGLQVDNRCIIINRNKFLHKYVVYPQGYPSALVPGHSGEQNVYLNSGMQTADDLCDFSWEGVHRPVRLPWLVTSCAFWTLFPSGKRHVRGSAESLQCTNTTAFLRTGTEYYTMEKDLPSYMIRVWHDNHWHERVRHNNQISENICKFCINFENIINFDGNLLNADEEKTCPWIIHSQ